jgi:hypothetical protein
MPDTLTPPIEAEPAAPETAPTSVLESLVDRSIPSQIDPLLKRLLGNVMKRGDEGLFRIGNCGRFDSTQMADLLNHARDRRLTGALVLVESDAERVLYFSAGKLVGASSTVLFERLGRLLYQVGVVTHESSNTLVDAEETRGAHSLLLWIPSGHLAWAVERRVWEVVAAIHFVKRGHFVFVEGEPEIQGPTVSLDASVVAREGKRRHEAFRNGPATDDAYHPPAMSPPPAAIAVRMRPVDISDEALEVVLQRIREAEAAPAQEA